jgi:hypothetical protein
VCGGEGLAEVFLEVGGGAGCVGGAGVDGGYGCGVNLGRQCGCGEGGVGEERVCVGVLGEEGWWVDSGLVC